MFLRHLRINGLQSDAAVTFSSSYDLSEAAFDIAGIRLPIKGGSRDTYFEPAATQGNSPAQFFRHREGPRQTFLNRIYTGLTGAGEKQPKLFAASQNRLPVELRLLPNWIGELRQYVGNLEVVDGQVHDLIAWLFRFGVPQDDEGRTAAIAADASENGLLERRYSTKLIPIPSTIADIRATMQDFIGLSDLELSSLFPQLVSADLSAFQSATGIEINDLAEALEKEFRPTDKAPHGADTNAVSAGHRVQLLPEIEIPDRIRRMIRFAITAYSAVLLVGPPGTGKTALLREIIGEIQNAPEAHGFSAPPRDPIWITPDESWTTRDLLGGETIDDDGRLRFRLGHVLKAIEEDRWLVLDEANRGDMDRIFGPLLSWLSGQKVHLGHASRELGAAPINIGWAGTPDSQVENLEYLSGKPSPKPISFLAGGDWRLLGTYNPLDAHKVFRFGQALARRFSEIPIPPVEPSTFAGILGDIGSPVPQEVIEALTGLYAAHYAQPTTQLGPAIFLRCLDYIWVALSQFDEAEKIATGEGDATSSTASENAGAAMSSVGDSEGRPENRDNAGTSNPTSNAGSGITRTELSQFIAEAYVASAGTYLAKFEDEELNKLGDQIVSTGALPESEWRWLRELLPQLA